MCHRRQQLLTSLKGFLQRAVRPINANGLLHATETQCSKEEKIIGIRLYTSLAVWIGAVVLNNWSVSINAVHGALSTALGRCSECLRWRGGIVQETKS